MLTDDQIIAIIKACPCEGAALLYAFPGDMLTGDLAKLTIQWARAVIAASPSASVPATSLEGVTPAAPTLPAEVREFIERVAVSEAFRGLSPAGHARANELLRTYGVNASEKGRTE